MTNIVLTQLTKRYGAVTAVDGLTADIRAGRITAFLGANGSGKTTTMRMLLGLAEPDTGSATIGGHRYADLPNPLHTVGAVLDQGFQPNRSAYNHLRIVAAQAQVPTARIDDVLELVELTGPARRRVGGYSLGMRQRLALASALIGSPSALVMDEPFNGLDPDGIATTRTFLRAFADNGGTVFLSSHLLAEVAHIADDVVIIDHGHLVSAGPLRELSAGSSRVAVTAIDIDLLAITLGNRGAAIERTGLQSLTVTGVTREDVARTAIETGVVVTELRTLGEDLESVFQNLINHHDPQEVTS